MAPRQAARAPRSGAGARTLPSALRSGPSSRDAIPAPPGPPGTRRPAGQGAGPGAASPGAAPAPGVPTPPPRGGRNSCAQPVGLRLPSPALGLQELVLKHPPGLKPRGPSARRPSRAWENVAVHGTRHREPSPPPRGPRGALGPPPAGMAAPPTTPERGFLDGDRPRRRAAPISDTHESLAYSLSSDLSMRTKRFTSYIPIWQGFDPW